jgi:hypothetical protein
VGFKISNCFEAKAVELDYNIPFISKLKRYCNVEGEPKEFREWERRLIRHLDWYSQIPVIIFFRRLQ